MIPTTEESACTLLVRVLPRGAPSASAPEFRVHPPTPSLAPVPSVLSASLGQTSAIATLRVVRHRLAERAGHRVIAVASPRGGEGSTTVAAQLAHVLAESDRAKVLLIEASFGAPSLARMLGVDVPHEAALSPQLEGRIAGVGSATWHVLEVAQSLHALVERDGDSVAPRALHSSPFRQLVTDARESYDFVVLDAPRVLGAPDAAEASASADCVVLTARGEVSRGRDLERACRAMAGKLAGVVLVAAPERRGRGARA